MGSGYARPQLLRLGPAPFCSRAAAPSAVLEEPVRSVAHGAVGTDNVDHPATTAICSKSLRAKRVTHTTEQSKRLTFGAIQLLHGILDHRASMISLARASNANGSAFTVGSSLARA
jgi:hypothetical protein